MPDADDPLPPVRNIRGMLTQIARRVRDDATKVSEWEAQSLLATTAEVLKCLDEAYERYELRHPAGTTPPRGPGDAPWNHPPGRA